MNPVVELRRRIGARQATAGVIGLGYVGLPLAITLARAGVRTLGFDIDPAKPAQLNSGVSYILGVEGDEVRRLVDRGAFQATGDLSRFATCDVLVICVPTPLTKQREPDLSFVRATTEEIARRLRPGQLVVLESTSYPGTTREVVKPILEAGGYRSEVDFLLAFSPEREDPGNRTHTTTSIPKIVAGDGPNAAQAVREFYASAVKSVVPVSSLEVAEAAKIAENIFRAVNIALVNELKMVFDAMGFDVWEVIDAAKTKPFGYMPFYPGPGLGGHCIPIDPFYLTWKAREFDMRTRFIELAGEINVGMPRYVASKLEEALDTRLSKALGASRILIVGLAYKPNVSDVRESPALKLIEILTARNVSVSYHDPHVAVIPLTREHAAHAGKRSVALDDATIAAHDAVVIVTDHDDIDYALIAREALLVVDTRNALARRGIRSERAVKA